MIDCAGTCIIQTEKLIRKKRVNEASPVTWSIHENWISFSLHVHCLTHTSMRGSIGGQAKHEHHAK
jgi:hypothetical protein